ncbi:hypothetical protein GCM10023238_20490 [Streptomyces heliomycini]
MNRSTRSTGSRRDGRQEVPRRADVQQEALTPLRAYPGGMDSEQPVCPACGQPVEKVVRRHKTLGAWVPVWGHGPCRNPECRNPAPAKQRSRGDRRLRFRPNPEGRRSPAPTKR